MRFISRAALLATTVGSLAAGPAFAAPPIWESSFGSILTALTGQDDDTDSASLSFNFPYLGTDYTTVYVGTNGCIQLGSLGTDNDIDYDHWDYFEEFINDAAPEICPLNTDLDLSTTGTIHFNDLGDHAVFTWNGVGTDQDETALSTFQVQIWNTGRIVFGYNGILNGPGENLLVSLNEGIVTGITLSDNVDPGPIDLNSAPLATGPTAYERWCYDTANSCGIGGVDTGLPGPTNLAFDLDQQNVIFDPIVRGSGFNVSSTFNAPQVVPTLSQWGLFLLGGLMALVAIFANRKRNAV